MQKRQPEELREGGSSGFKSGGRSGEVRIERTFSNELKRGHPLVAYESAWVPAIRKIDWVAGRAGARDQILVSADGQEILLERLDVHEGRVMGEETWSGLCEALLSHKKCVFNPWVVTYRIHRNHIEQVIEDSPYQYHPVKDEWVLRHLLYRHKSRERVAEELDVTQPKVEYWTDKKVMEDLYALCGGNSKNISNYLKHRKERTNDYLSYMSHKGYPCWFFDEEGSKRRVRVHRLAAVAKFGFDSVKGMSVHHQSGVPWDNRLSNLELISNEKHAKHHNLAHND